MGETKDTDNFSNYWKGRLDGTILPPKPAPPKIGWWKLAHQISWICCIDCPLGIFGPVMAGFKNIEDFNEHLKEHTEVLDKWNSLQQTQKRRHLKIVLES